MLHRFRLCPARLRLCARRPAGPWPRRRGAGRRTAATHRRTHRRDAEDRRLLPALLGRPHRQPVARNFALRHRVPLHHRPGRGPGIQRYRPRPRPGGQRAPRLVLLAVPFSAVGAVWFLYLAGYNMSVAVWVGLIALLGIDAETGVFMLLYLDLAYAEAMREGRLHSLADLREAIGHGAAKRLRPKFMTFATTCVGLFPIMWATGAGSDVMKRIAAPMVGGIFTSFALELLVYPAIYEIWRWHTAVKKLQSSRSYAGESVGGLDLMPPSSALNVFSD